MTHLTTHVLDTALGRPASGLKVRLERLEGDAIREVATDETDSEGRVRMLGLHYVSSGRYRLVFETGAWFRATGRESLYPEVVIHLSLSDAEPHYHIPLLLAPFGYSTYRGT